ncbi:MAG TPA: hypothetical protein VLA12_06915 [Planctomycetaceae bacterium]|nr:hypothetical protein [Planctomycetaceae bacterium]
MMITLTTSWTTSLSSRQNSLLWPTKIHPNRFWQAQRLSFRVSRNCARQRKLDALLQLRIRQKMFRPAG